MTLTDAVADRPARSTFDVPEDLRVIRACQRCSTMCVVCADSELVCGGGEPVCVPSCLDCGTICAASALSAEAARRQGAGSMLRRLSPSDDDTLVLEVWTRKRNTPDQLTCLAVRASGVDLVVHSREPDLGHAMAELKPRMRRRLSDPHDRRRSRSRMR